MKVLNGLLIVCALLLFYIGISTEPKVEQQPVNTLIKLDNPIVNKDLRPNIEIVIDQLYPMVIK